MALILYDQKDSIGTLTLNNPDQLNAINPEMGDELNALILDLQKRKDLRVLLITGTGKAFSAGGNLQFILDHTPKTPEVNKQEMIEFYSRFLSIRDLSVPTIAVLNGPAVGAGCCIAMACDLRVASENAKLSVNFAKIGLSSGMGGLYFLTQLVGPAIAAELLFTGKTVAAAEAYRMGLVNHVYPASDLQNEALQLAQHIAQNAPLPLTIMKRGIQKATFATLQEIFDYESGGQAECFATADLKEGIAAIQEKRKPRFGGK